MAREIPIDHELRSSRYMQCFSFVLNNNGECYITRNGYFGAEYYDRDSAIRRLQEFVEFGFIVVVTVFFTAGDKKEDHYASSEEQRDLIKEQLEGIKISRVIFDVGNKKDKNGGWVSKPEFYYYRDNCSREVAPIGVSDWD